MRYSISSEREPLSLANIPREQSKVYDMLCEADAIGVFQGREPGADEYAAPVEAREFYDLVVEVAIVRPGPIQGNMVHPYLRRRKNAEEVRFLAFVGIRPE